MVVIFVVTNAYEVLSDISNILISAISVLLLASKVFVVWLIHVFFLISEIVNVCIYTQC